MERQGVMAWTDNPAHPARTASPPQSATMATGFWVRPTPESPRAVQLVTQAQQARRGYRGRKAQQARKALQVLTAQQAYKAPLAQKETLVIPDRPARAPTPPLKLVVTRAHRPIFTLTLPQ